MARTSTGPAPVDGALASPGLFGPFQHTRASRAASTWPASLPVFFAAAPALAPGPFLALELQQPTPKPSAQGAVLPRCLRDDQARATGAPQARAIDTVSFTTDANSKPRPQPTLSRLDRLGRASSFHRINGRQSPRRHLQRRSAEAFSRPRHPQATFPKLCELPARRLASVLTQHKITFSCLFSTQKCCVSVSSCQLPRSAPGPPCSPRTPRCVSSRYTARDLAERRPPAKHNHKWLPGGAPKQNKCLDCTAAGDVCGVCVDVQ